jgi:hypothetical protein
MMTKRDTIEAIRGYNATANPEFLAEFPSEELTRYLDRLTTLQPSMRTEILPELLTLEDPD